MKMSVNLFHAALLTVACSASPALAATRPEPATHAEAAPSAVTGRIIAAAQAFLATLDEAQRAKLVFPATDEAQRNRWSNFPTGIFARKGLRLGDLSPAQSAAADALLAASFSPEGFRKLHEIVDGDEVLRKSERVGRLVFGAAEYYLSFVGSPAAESPWTLQFGGHHLALNLTIDGAKNIVTPSHTAAQPARYTLNGKTVRPLGAESDRGFALMAALNETQRKEAIIGARFRDLVLGPGQGGRKILPEGVKVSTFTADQQSLLVELARCWIGLVQPEAAEAKLAEFKANFADTYFAWSGPTTPGSAAYFRIHGPTVFIEFAPQSMGGDATNHIHTIYRDPQHDTGKN